MSNYYVTRGVVNSGTIVMSCDGTCDHPTLEHRFMFYTLEEAQDAYRRQHKEHDYCFGCDYFEEVAGTHMLPDGEEVAMCAECFERVGN